MSDGGKIRVVIADDSAFMRKVISSILSADPEMEIAGEARDGLEVISVIESLQPDVVIMDISMPHRDGLRATEIIMGTHPRPVVMIGAETSDAGESAFQALKSGALEFVAKPAAADLDVNGVREELVCKVKRAARSRLAQEVRP